MDLKKFIPWYIRYRIMELRGRDIYSCYPDKYHCIFIHIPKTAGTSVAKALFDVTSGHIRYTEYEKVNPQKFDRYFKFAFVRNPLDRLYSAFSFMKKGGMHETDRRWAEQNLSRYVDFDSFVKGWVTPENVWSWVHFMPQHHFICDDKLNLKIDFVGKFESLDRDVAYIQETLGLPQIPLPHINSSSSKATYLDHYNVDSRMIVESVYKNDFDFFNYHFDDQTPGAGKEHKK